MNNTMESNINAIGDDTEEQRRDRGFEGISFNRNLFTNFCQLSSVLIFLVLIAIIPSKFI
jgi:hypothetical protein